MTSIRKDFAMCNNEALVNTLLDLIERHGTDPDGRFDRDRSKAVMLQYCHATGVVAEDEE
jgi:hypothetical protein